MISFKHPDISVKIFQIGRISGNSESLPAEIYLENGDSRDLGIIVTENELFTSNGNEQGYYELHVEYDGLHCEAKDWILRLDVNDLECNDFTFQDPNETEDIIRFIEKLLLSDILFGNLTDKTSSAKVKTKKL